MVWLQDSYRWWGLGRSEVSMFDICQSSTQLATKERGLGDALLHRHSWLVAHLLRT